MYCCSWIYSKVFPYKVLKKDFPKNPFLIKTFCYRNCTLYAGAADILLSLSILLEILSEFNIGYWINFIVSCIFEIYFFFQLIDHGSVRYPKILGKTRFFWWIWEIVSKLNLYPTFLVPKLNSTQPDPNPSLCKSVSLLASYWFANWQKMFLNSFFP